MAVLNRDEFFERINRMVGDDSSDDAIAFIEDMSDTYNDFENRLTGDGEDWERRYRELDESWKKKYKSRFFTGKSEIIGIDEGDNDEADSEVDPEEVQIEDLFEKKED